MLSFALCALGTRTARTIARVVDARADPTRGQLAYILLWVTRLKYQVKTGWVWWRV